MSVADSIQKARSLVEALELIQCYDQEVQFEMQPNIAERVTELANLKEILPIFNQSASAEEKAAFSTLLGRASKSEEAIALSLQDFQAWAEISRAPAAAVPLAPKQPVVLTPKPPAAAPQLKPKPAAAPSPKQVDDARLRMEQDRAYYEGLVRDQINTVEKAWQAIYSALTNNPKTDFELILPFYKQYSKRDPSILPEAQLKICDYLETAADYLEQTMIEQDRNDKEAMRKFEAENARPNLMRSLITALDRNDDHEIQSLTSQLSGDEKDRLRAELSKILNRQVGPGLLRLSLKMWPGDISQKKQAVAGVLGPIAVSTPPECFAEVMKQRFIQGAQAPAPLPMPVLTPKKPAANAPQAPAPATPLYRCENLLLGARQLNELIYSIASDDFAFNVSLVESLDVRSNIGSFADRMAYHVYFIHKSERRISRDDAQYGTKALFRGEGLHATDNDRRRAIVRVIAEVSLEGLKLALQTNDHGNVRAFLDILENLGMDPKDCPREPQNLAHFLFGAFYRGYLSAQEQDPSLIHPHHVAFRNDFGRLAFRNDAGPAIDARFKIEAIAQLETALKAVWKI